MRDDGRLHEISIYLRKYVTFNDSVQGHNQVQKFSLTMVKVIEDVLKESSFKLNINVVDVNQRYGLNTIDYGSAVIIDRINLMSVGHLRNRSDVALFQAYLCQHLNVLECFGPCKNEQYIAREFRHPSAPQRPIVEVGKRDWRGRDDVIYISSAGV